MLNFWMSSVRKHQTWNSDQSTAWKFWKGMVEFWLFEFSVTVEEKLGVAVLSKPTITALVAESWL